ncbi:MAG: M15 family metallopeptidase [Bacteroidia bacterium]
MEDSITVSSNVGGPSIAQERLLQAYPEHLTGIEGNELVWKDGTRMVWDDGKSGKAFEELEAKPDIEDMFAFEYPDSFEWEFVENQDPGRIRNEAFFRKMYGGTAQEVGKHLVHVDWFGHRIQVSKVNGVDAALLRVAKRLEAYPDLIEYLRPPGGGYNWRPIAGTDRLSAHSFGIAVDICTQYSDYWRWSPEFSKGKPLVYKNRIPKLIVEAFEAEGFIWGGKWFHFDTMHFEYRPELL